MFILNLQCGFGFVVFVLVCLVWCVWGFLQRDILGFCEAGKVSLTERNVSGSGFCFFLFFSVKCLKNTLVGKLTQNIRKHLLDYSSV